MKIITKKNGGVSSARNAGIRKATGKYLFFLDADDYIDKRVIENLVLEMQDGIKLVGCEVEVVSGDSTKILKRKSVYSKDEFCMGILNNELQGFSWGYLFDTKICRKVLFDRSLSYCEDLVFVSKYIEKANIDNVYFISKRYQDTLHYVQHADSVTLSRNEVFRNLSSAQNALRIFNETTKFIYKKQIDDKLIILFESELQKILSSRGYLAIFDNFQLPKYHGLSLRYKIFMFIYQNKMSLIMLFYYKVRKVVKNLKRSSL